MNIYPETNIFAPENQWLGLMYFLLGFGLFSGAKLLVVSGRVNSHGVPMLPMLPMGVSSHEASPPGSSVYFSC